MATTAPAPGHRRNKSASVLKSIIGHKRTPSDGTPLHKSQPDTRSYNPTTALQAPLLPPDHPHNQLRAVPRAEHIPTENNASRKSQDVKARPTRSLHKKTLSSVSLRSLGKEKEKTKERQTREPSRTRGEDSTEDNPRKKKSSGNLAAMFGKGRHKDTKQTPGRDKENTTPPSSANAPGPAHTPIWAEFSSTPLQEITTTSKVPLNDQRRSIEEEIALYTPRDYSPSKQRNFFDYGQPSLQKRPLAKERPKSTILPTNASATSLIENWSRKKSMDRERTPLSDTKGNESRQKEATPSKKTSAEESRKTKDAKQAANAAKKQNRVMAAVAALNGKSKQAEARGAKLNPKVVDAEFEEVLESRNIPMHQRAQMRTLKIEVKADFVRTHKLDTPQSSRVASAHSTINETSGKQSTKHTLSRTAKSRDGTSEDEKVSSQSTAEANSTKRERPRSRTFTFNRSDSPTKKQKGDAISGDAKASSKSTAIPKSPSTRSLASNASDRSLSKGSKTIMPNEFITYLKKTPKPQEVEVGKLHKLRLLLRNETVEWVDTFIGEGGLTELVGLLHRIMEVEWREDHEDTLLHELLRCLKGLCTTDCALKQLAGLAPTLFPALLGMLFDEEHKGPSEFTTRELIIQIVFAHISMAPESELQSRATELLKYLKDPVKEKDSSTVPFILQMHQPRPYQVWCKEITNVTKEVFWIFIHHLNVVPLPPALTPQERSQPYAKIHFPGQRAIVPAAPYVGGVEWDATNYIATHLDLINGLLASLPTREARNGLRNEMKVSGFEKLMGHLRACNPKYYGAVHDSVKVWIGAALVDDWDVRTVRMGPSESKPASPVKQSPKKKAEKPPQIQAPKMDVSLGLGLGFDKDIAIGHQMMKRDDDWI